MWLESSLPLKVTQAYKDQIVIIALNQNNELVQDFSLPYHDLLLCPALSNRIKKSKAHENFKWVDNSKL